MMDKTCLLKISDLSFAYEGKPPLFSDLNLNLYAGEVLGLAGPSGCGKSTLCYCLCGIIPHIRQGNLRGEVLVCGKKVSEEKPATLATKVGIVFQNPEMQLFSDFVEEDIVFGMENLCFSWQQMDQNLREVMTLLGMEELQYCKTNQLSGGQKQLAAIASVLVMGTEVLILDEAMTQLDRAGKQRLTSVIRTLTERKKAVIMVEHDEKNLRIADKILELK